MSEFRQVSYLANSEVNLFSWFSSNLFNHIGQFFQVFFGSKQQRITLSAELEIQDPLFTHMSQILDLKAIVKAAYHQAK